MYVFDLEGTLVDTTDAKRLAYSDVGVQATYDDLAKPWHLWLPSKFGTTMAATEHEQAVLAHERMLARWPARLHAARALALGHLAQRLENFCLLTESTPPLARMILRDVLGVNPDGVQMICELNSQTKLAALKTLGARETHGCFFDDNGLMIQEARRVLPETWSVCLVTR